MLGHFDTTGHRVIAKQLYRDAQSLSVLKWRIHFRHLKNMIDYVSELR